MHCSHWYIVDHSLNPVYVSIPFSSHPILYHHVRTTPVNRLKQSAVHLCLSVNLRREGDQPHTPRTFSTGSLHSGQGSPTLIRRLHGVQTQRWTESPWRYPACVRRARKLSADYIS